MAIDLAGFTPTFEDEFTRFSWAGDGGTWTTKFGFGGRSLPSNGEQEYYSDPSTAVASAPGYVTPHTIVADPTQPGDGILRLTASASPDPSQTDGLPYVSGMVTSQTSFTQQYGYFEISAKVPDGQGLWPGFWMLPADGSFPPEIDVLEYLGKTNANGDGGDTEFWWYLNSSDESAKRGGWFDAGVDLSADFHRYGVLWTPDYVAYTFDGEEIPGSRSATPSDMHKPMYMIANLAVGGNWPGAADPSLFGSTDPAQLPHLDIDSIRAWSLPDTMPPGEPGGPVNTGGDGPDLIGGLTGLADVLTGGKGSDIFAFLEPKPGDDIIADFTPASRGGTDHDLLEFAHGVVKGPDGFAKLLPRIHDTADGAVINIGGGSQITLAGVHKAELSAADFLFS